MDYQYRVVYRLRREFWTKTEDEQWRTYSTKGNPAARPYTNAQAVKGIVTAENNFSHRSKGQYEFKAQRFPLTQEWEDM
jgi:hypothetical protein